MSRYVLALLALCGFLFFYGINTGELWRTESLRAIVAAEGLRSGDWLVPTLYGQPLFTKPPGMYVAIALASWPIGEVREWTARLPSAIAATVVVLLIYWHFGRELGRRSGFVAALILPLSVAWLDKAPSAEIDMLQVMWVSAAILAFLRALETEEESSHSCTTGFQPVRDSLKTCPTSRHPESLGWWLLALLCVAGGVLTKWTAPAFFYGTVLPLLFWRGRLRLLLGWRHLLSASLAVLLCCTWAALAVQRGGWDMFVDTVGREAWQHLSPEQRATTVFEMHHVHQSYWSEVLLHPLKVLGMSLPWSAFALLACRPGFFRVWDERGQRLLQALHCWTWPNLLLWSLLPQHSPRHSLPLLPGLSGLAALVWIAWLDDRFRLGNAVLSRQRLPVALLTAIVLVWLGVKLAFVHAVLPQRTAQRAPRERGEQLAAQVPADQTLYLCRVKDEGIMFYYRRPVCRLANWHELPSFAEPSYCIVEETELPCLSPGLTAETLSALKDEQGTPLVLVRVWKEK
jgi:4-amino-4-deoxy-L-arabinose transferase-like glycosyltransferase